MEQAGMKSWVGYSIYSLALNENSQNLKIIKE
jgi:hypothetical protein